MTVQSILTVVGAAMTYFLASAKNHTNQLELLKDISIQDISFGPPDTYAELPPML